MIANLALIVAVLTGGHGPMPAEDDARHRITWALATLATGGAESYPVYEWTRHAERGRVLFVGLVTDDECSTGAFYFRRTRTWTPLRRECP